MPLERMCICIQATKAYNKLPMLHYKTIKGIVDRDRRTEEEIGSLLKEKIYVPLVSEIENLFLIPKVIELVAKKQNIENVDDLFQIGCIGLIKAIDNFDVSQGVQFSTYAVPMITGEIKRYLRDNSAIRVSRSLKDMAYKALYTKEQLLKSRQKEPTISEIASEIGASKEDIVIALEAVSPTVSLYEPVFNEGGDTLYVIDQIKDKADGEENWVTHLALDSAFAKLSGREQQIIRKRFMNIRHRWR